MKTPTRFHSIVLVAASVCAFSAELYAQTTWDAGGGADTSINLNTNWNNISFLPMMVQPE